MPRAAAGAEDQAFVPLDSLPSAASLQTLRVLLELLMLEIKMETKKHLMMQLQLAAAAAAGSAGVTKPDASLARPLKQAKQMIKAVHTMQLMAGFPAQLLAAADMSELWAGVSCGDSLAAFAAQQQRRRQAAQAVAEAAVAGHSDVRRGRPAPLYGLLFDDASDAGSCTSQAVRVAGAARESVPGEDTGQQGQQQERRCSDVSAAAGEVDSPDAAAEQQQALPQQALASFPSALIAACTQQLEQMPAELPLVALHVLWDARQLLQRLGLLDSGLLLLQCQEEVCLSVYMQQLVPTTYEHFKASRCPALHARALEMTLALPRCSLPQRRRLLTPALRASTEECRAPDGHRGAAGQLRRGPAGASEAAVP
jgi:hypothetical protein